MNRLLISVLLLSASVLSFGQKAWTLEDCIRYSHENNLQVKRQSLNTAISEVDLTQARMQFLPSVNAGIQHTISSGRVLNTDNYTWDDKTFENGGVGLSANYTLFKGLQNYHNLQVSRYQLEANMQLTEKMKNDISVTIALAYLQILFDRELSEIANQQLKFTEFQAVRVGKLVEAGSKARGELLEIEAQVASDNLTLINARNSFSMSKLNLAQMLDLDSVENFDVIVPAYLPLDTNQLPKVDSVYALALVSMPQVRSKEFSLKAAQSEVRLARSNYSPELYLSGNYNSRYTKGAIDPMSPLASYSYTNQLLDNQYRSLGINLSIPIFNKYYIQSQVARSRIQLEDARIQLRQEQLALYKDIQQAHADAVAAKARFQAADEAVKSNNEALKYTIGKYDVGIANALEFNEAKKNAAKSASDYLQAKYEYCFKLKILDFYAGKPIGL